MARHVTRAASDDSQEWDFRHKVRVPLPVSDPRLIEMHNWCGDAARPGEYLCYMRSGLAFPDDPLRRKSIAEVVFGFTEPNVAIEFKLRFV